MKANKMKVVIAAIIVGGLIIMSYIFSPSRPKVNVTAPDGTNIHIERKGGH